MCMEKHRASQTPLKATACLPETLTRLDKNLFIADCPVRERSNKQHTGFRWNGVRGYIWAGGFIRRHEPPETTPLIPTRTNLSSMNLVWQCTHETSRPRMLIPIVDVLGHARGLSSGPCLLAQENGTPQVRLGMRTGTRWAVWGESKGGAPIPAMPKMLKRLQQLPRAPNRLRNKIPAHAPSHSYSKQVKCAKDGMVEKETVSISTAPCSAVPEHPE